MGTIQTIAEDIMLAYRLTKRPSVYYVLFNLKQIEVTDPRILQNEL